MMTTGRSVDALIAALERAPALVIPLVRQADPAILKRRPAPGDWSIHENACHLAEVHPLFRDDPEDALLKLDLEDSLRRFAEDRARLVSRLEALAPADWHRAARHDEYNAYSIFIMFRHLALHDFDHAYRIEELLLRKDWPAPSALRDA